MEVTQDRTSWFYMQMAYIQQWTSIDLLLMNKSLLKFIFYVIISLRSNIV